jgi:hypothetical protein
MTIAIWGIIIIVVMVVNFISTTIQERRRA